jgi:RNA polymerase sigma-70 factor (ECF subfamily)
MTDATNITRANEHRSVEGRHVTALEAGFAAGVAGDSRAYEAALTRVAALVRQLAHRQRARGHLGGADVEDVVQEVLLAIHDKRHTWDAGRPLEPWIAGIVRYKLLTARRARARDRLAAAALLDDLAEILPAPAEAEGAGASGILDWLPLLPARERGVVAGLVLEEMSPQALAQRMEITENAVHAAWSRAVARLARRFGRVGRRP